MTNGNRHRNRANAWQEGCAVASEGYHGSAADIRVRRESHIMVDLCEGFRGGCESAVVSAAGSSDSRAHARDHVRSATSTLPRYDVEIVFTEIQYDQATHTSQE